MTKTELFGAASCPYSREMREWLEWQGREFIEHDVEGDPEAMHRMLAATGGQTTIPVLMEDGEAVQIGWQGRGCVVAAPRSRLEFSPARKGGDRDA
jgi:glutaredoxin